MKTFIYQADVYCEECGANIRRSLTASGLAPKDPDDENTYDSDNFPKGPHEADEADCPQHCGHCHRHLNAPLTTDGVSYVEESLEEAVAAGERTETLDEWAKLLADYGNSDALSAYENLPELAGA